MIGEIVEHWITYFQSRKEIKNEVKFWSPVNIQTIGEVPAVIFQPVAKVDKQLAEAETTYPSYDMIIRVVSAARASEIYAFKEAERIANIITALVRCNPKLYDRQNIFSNGSPYFLNNSDVIGFSYIEDKPSAAATTRAGTFQKEIKIFLRCYRAEGVDSIPGVRPPWEEGDPAIPVDSEEALGWFMPEDQTLYYFGVDRDRMILRFYRESVLSDIYNVGTGEHERFD